LRDRMEVIQLAGYSEEDKVRIARQYVIRKQIEENGITPDMIDFTDVGLKKIISEYTREAGLRNFERLVGTCCRKVAKDVATWDGTTSFATVAVDEPKVELFLGPPKYLPTDQRESNEIGCVTGLAWTQMGGEVLEVEATAMKGRGGIILTGSLGDVMKESCHAAMSWIRAHAKELSIDENYFSKNEVHIHFPSGAVPKDGPSAGVTITTAIVSLLTNIPVKKDVAMTGEISLLGKVLPIGGVKEKSLAALRHGIKKVLLPFRNEKDLAEIPAEYMKKIEFTTVKNIHEVLNHALVQSPFKNKKATGSGSSRGGFGKEPAAASSHSGSSSNGKGRSRRIEEAA
jgi:ATP-dependent Lon protease